MDANNHQLIIFAKILLINIFMCVFVSCSKSSPTTLSAYDSSSQNNTTFLTQGWDMATRQKVSYLSFGSRMIDYSWFIVLEQAENDKFFREQMHMSRLGFITESANEFNPDGLPVGICRDEDSNGSTAMGLTCAACHTGEVQVQGHSIRIDGGQSLINYTQFENELLYALKATLAQPEKWQRFISRLNDIEKSQSKKITDADILKKNLQTRIQELETRHAINATDVAYGHGRLDAFGQIFNAISVEALGIPENKHSPDAPTSFPMLWDASHLDVVQWNASAPNKTPGPLLQNSTTAMAVYGTVNVRDHSLSYPSSTQINNLGYIQAQFYQLTSPQWPEELAGKLDKNAIEQGKNVYAKNCMECHSLVNSADPKRKINAVLVPIDKVGTDPRMAINFSTAKVKTGALEGKKFALFFGKKFGTEASTIDVVMHVTAGTLLRHPIDSLRAVIEEYADNNSVSVPEDLIAYKARPINGIWASAPYLHNGSVPTVYDLLQPAALRPTQFYVGNRELDTVKVGNQITQTDASSLFDTSLPGNTNVGHEYGTQLSDPEKLALLEYLKSL